MDERVEQRLDEILKAMKEEEREIVLIKNEDNSNKKSKQ